MQAVIKDTSQLEPSLLHYLENNPIPLTTQLVGKPKRYRVCASNQEFGGLHRKLRAAYYPKYKRSRRRRKTAKKGSTKAQGIRVDNEICAFVAGKKPRKKRHWMTDKLIEYWTKRIKHTMQVAQLPVMIGELGCMTQVDVVTRDKHGELHMWEVKTGFPPGGARKKGFLSKTKIPNTLYNHWELQRHYSWVGMNQGGIDIKYENTHVINIYMEAKNGKNVAHIQSRPHPKWVGKFCEK